MDIQAERKAAEQRIAQHTFETAQAEFDNAAAILSKLEAQANEAYTVARAAVEKHKELAKTVTEANGLLSIAQERLDRAARDRYGIGRLDAALNRDAEADMIAAMASKFSPSLVHSN